MTTATLGTTLIYGFFIDYLAGQKGLRPTSIRSYRDAVRLFLLFVSADARPSRKMSIRRWTTACAILALAASEFEPSP